MAYILNRLDEISDELEKLSSRTSLNEREREQEKLNRPSRHSPKKSSSPKEAAATTSKEHSVGHRMFFENPTNEQLLVIKNYHENLLENQILYNDIITSGGFVPGTESGEYESDEDEMDEFEEVHRRYCSPDNASRKLSVIEEQLKVISHFYDLERVIHSRKAKNYSWKPHIVYSMLKGVTEDGTHLYYAKLLKEDSQESIIEINCFPESMIDLLESLTMFYSM
jgi:hypothetical protein